LTYFLSGSYVPHDISFLLQHIRIDNIENIHRIIIEVLRSKPRGMRLLLRFKAFLERIISMKNICINYQGFLCYLDWFQPDSQP